MASLNEAYKTALECVHSKEIIFDNGLVVYCSKAGKWKPIMECVEDCEAEK